jgi:hypothetical protein
MESFPPLMLRESLAAALPSAVVADHRINCCGKSSSGSKNLCRRKNDQLILLRVLII